MQQDHGKVLAVIPARIGSTRIPAKMLANVHGKPLIQRTIERTLEATLIDTLLVATDSPEVAAVAESLGVKAVMTDPEIPTGTDRVLAVAEQFTDFTPELVVNVWGDEPLYPAETIDDCIRRARSDQEAVVVLAGDRIRDHALLDQSSIVQVLTDINDNVLCFTRAAAPFNHTGSDYDHHHVIGVMAIRGSFITTFKSLARTPIEQHEGVEQMRILEHGHRIGLVKVDCNNLGVNEPSELEQVRQLYKDKEG